MTVNPSAERPISIAPLLCTSTGIFMVAVGLLAMLPGRDTAQYLQNGGAKTLNEALVADARGVAAQGRVLPAKENFVFCKGRFYHWNPKCQLLHHARERRPLPVYNMTRAEAEEHGYYPCDFCDRQQEEAKN